MAHGSTVRNEAKIMPIFPIQGQNNGVWGTDYSDFFSPIFDLNTGAFNLSQSLLSSLDGSLDIGAPTKRFQNGYFSGTVRAARIEGDGSALTGFGGTGGLINTGSTTIGADSDSSGGGEIAFQIKGSTVMTIANDGRLALPEISGNVGIGNPTPSNLLSLRNTNGAVEENYLLDIHNTSGFAGNEAGISFTEHVGGNTTTTAAIAAVNITGVSEGSLVLRTNQSTLNTLVDVLTLDQDGNVFINSGALLGSEIPAPPPAQANGYRMYAEDNGSGKTKLMVIFSSGSAQQIAIEP